MTKLSVNINKIATLRNSRGGNIPDLIKVAEDVQEFGAEGITVHPRPDQRHIRYSDVYDLKSVVKTEYNIEGNPVLKFIDLVTDTKPTQVTLVPDTINDLTSNSGWDTIKHKDFLAQVVKELKKNNIRTSIFIQTNAKLIEGAAKIGADRVELYTEKYARDFAKGDTSSVLPYIQAAKIAKQCGLGLNAGHDLNIDNIAYFVQKVPNLLEVSIGHALISESLYLGLENVINMYLYRLKQLND